MSRFYRATFMQIIKTVAAASVIGGCQSKPKVTDSKNPPNANLPKLLKPTARRTWIPQKIEDDGRVLIEGHWRYEVTGGSSWSR